MNLSKCRSNKIFLVVFILLTFNLLLTFLPETFAASQASFTWDPNPDPDVAGYRVYCREQNRAYDNAAPLWEGTATQSTVYGLDESTSYCCAARAFDTEGFESEDSNEVCFDPSDTTGQPSPANEPPSASAGDDQTVGEGAVVTLDGSASLDFDDGIASYRWTQSGSPAVNLANSNTATPTFIAPNVGPEGVSLVFSLTVTDAGGLQNTDACIVNIPWLNEPPTAVITPDYLETTGDTLVTLDGAASADADDGIAAYRWTQIKGAPVALVDAAASKTSFMTPKTDVYDENIVLQLTVTDHGGLKDSAESSVYVRQAGAPALTSMVIAGLTQVEEYSGAQYHLTAHYSDGNSTRVTGSAEWTENCSSAGIDNSGYLTTGSVSADQTCTISATFEGQSDTHEVSIRNVDANISPAAAFSYVARRKIITFKDLSTDSDGTIASWQWNFGDGTYNVTRNPVHRYTRFGDYTVTLTVTDDKGTQNTISRGVSVKNR